MKEGLSNGSHSKIDTASAATARPNAATSIKKDLASLQIKSSAWATAPPIKFTTSVAKACPKAAASDKKGSCILSLASPTVLPYATTFLSGALGLRADMEGSASYSPSKSPKF
jgi:hypothetical protein